MRNFIRYLPKFMHATGAILCIVSGIPSLPNNPGYVFNIAFGGLIGFEAIPKKAPKKYPPSSERDALGSAYHGITYSRNVKMLFAGALAAMSIWFAMQGYVNYAINSAFFTLGALFSVGASEIERHQIKKILNDIVNKKE